MNVEIIQDYYQYNAWANKRILETASRLTLEQLQRDANPSFGSVHNTLVHIMSGQWLWLNRWQGTYVDSMLDPQSYSDLSNLRSSWDAIDKMTGEFVQRCKESDLTGTNSYTNFQGEKRTHLLWQQMLHQVNHATQHRSEVAMILTGWNFSPGAMDFIVYINERNAEKN